MNRGRGPQRPGHQWKSMIMRDPHTPKGLITAICATADGGALLMFVLHQRCLSSSTKLKLFKVEACSLHTIEK